VRHLYRLLDAGAPWRDAGMGLRRLLRGAQNVGYAGTDLTHTFKRMVLPHLDGLAATASRMGAVNTVVFTPDGRTMGRNTDISGFTAAFTRALPGASLRRVVRVAPTLRLSSLPRPGRAPCRR
jgi:shikimate dehydrogenase